MNKKQYLEPTMQTVELNHKSHILVESQQYGVNSTLQNDEVNEAWVKSNSPNSVKWDDDWSE